jgi:hypothetical protein
MYDPSRFLSRFDHTAARPYDADRQDRKEDWVDSIWFAGDKFVTEREKRNLSDKGGFDPVIKMEKDANGIWHGIRDIMF